MFDPNKVGFTEKFRTKIRAYKAINKNQLKINERSMCEYIALMYDKGSPLWLEVPDYFRRKYEAAVAAGFKVNTAGKFEIQVERMLAGEIPQVNNVIIGYIGLFGLSEYFQLVAYTALQAAEMRKILEGDQNQYTMKTIDVVGERIRELQNKLLHTDGAQEAEEMRKAIYATINEDAEKLKLRPEQIIRQLKKEGKLSDDWSPYEEDFHAKALEAFRFWGDKKQEDDDGIRDKA